MAAQDDLCRVLSIQSHVVSGYVGNKSASFPLQLLGFEVDAINSVQFSNHKGYPSCRGQILDSAQLEDLYKGLKENNLTTYSHILTGFIGSESFHHKIVDVVRDLKKMNPNLIYLCDPVMGDNGKMYVPPELLPTYQKDILPLADIITPNQFEAELLSGVKIHDEKSALVAMEKLHEMGCKTVVISSSDLGSDDVLIGLGSSVTNGSRKGIRMEMPKFPAIFTGTGDLFASLLLAWLHKHPTDLELACEKTVSTMQKVLRRTYTRAKELSGLDKEPTRAQMELRLIQSKSDIEDPVICIKATPIF